MISIHAPHTESDGKVILPEGIQLLFQSTLPVQRATSLQYRHLQTLISFQSTLPVRRATGIMRGLRPSIPFQSTLPVRRAAIFLREAGGDG